MKKNLPPHGLESYLYTFHDHNLYNLLMCDCGVNLPDGWKIIPRHERYYYDNELYVEYGRLNKPTQEFTAVGQPDTPFLYSLLCGNFVIIAVNNNRILAITDREEAPVVLLKLDWSGESKLALSQSQLISYSSIEEFRLYPKERVFKV